MKIKPFLMRLASLGAVMAKTAMALLCDRESVTKLVPTKPVHPSRIWTREMMYREWTIDEFCRRSGLSLQRVCLPFHIDQEFAEGCARAFDSSPELWLNLQRNYDNHCRLLIVTQQECSIRLLLQKLSQCVYGCSSECIRVEPNKGK
jgi:plasmid maintenance system antidote protein VapI